MRFNNINIMLYILFSLVFFCNFALYAENWTYEYNSSNGMRPERIKYGSKKTFLRGYQVLNPEDKAFSSMKLDKHGRIFLNLKNNGNNKTINNCNSQYAHYLLTFNKIKPNSNTSIIESKFRLGEKNQKKAQFSIMFQKRITTEKSFFLWMAFAKDKITAGEGKTRLSQDIKFNNKWQQIKIIVYWAKRKGYLYLNKSRIPFFVFKLNKGKGNGRLQFGDSSSSVEGSADVMYFKIKY